MDYSIFITDNTLACLKSYFEVSPFTMQAAFALSEINKRPECSIILLNDFYKLQEADYESRTHEHFCFYSKKLLDILHQSSYKDKISFLYIHSHNSSRHNGYINDDHEIIFRISYAYVPFSIHASLFYYHGKITGNIWLPTLETHPLNIIYEQ